MTQVWYFIFGAVVGVVLIWFFVDWAKASKNKKMSELVQRQTKEKAEHLQKILKLAQGKEKITNNDAEKLLSVSNATAERYLDELEKQGKLKQVGKTGQSVYYTKT
jgi:predicted HTH transcriptional regulator